MALRWTAAAMLEVAKGFRRLKADLQLPILTAALAANAAKLRRALVGRSNAHAVLTAEPQNEHSPSA